MAENRYVGFDYDQPVSNYVPLPLDAIYKIGQDASKKYEDTLKDMDSGKDPISKLNTRSVARIYDPAKGGMVDAPIDFEGEKQHILSYMNTQKQQIVDDYIKDKDNSKYQQRALRLKGEINSAYSDLASKSAIVEQINKENIELGKSEAYGLNPAYATKRLQYNTEYLKNLQEGNVQAYAPPAVAKAVSMEDVIAKDVSGWTKSDMGSKAYTDGMYIHDINSKGITGTRVYDYANRIWADKNHSARAVAELELEHALGMNGLKRDSMIDYQDYKRDSEGNVFKDKDGNPVIETKKGKFADVFLEEKKQDYTQALADKLIHQTIDPKMTADAYGLFDYKQKVAEESAKDYTNTSSVGNPTATNIQQLLSDNGLSEFVDSDGNIKRHSAGLKSAVINGMLMMIPYGASDADVTVNAAYKKSAEIGKSLGLPTPKNGNWVKAVYNHFVNVSKQASTTSDFHPSTAESLTKNFLGENSDLGNMEIYPQGSQNKNDKATATVAGVLAKNSKFSGIDYFSNDNAGLRLAYTPKKSDGTPAGPDESYVAIPKNKNLLAEAEPVRHISNAYLQRMKNPQAYEKAVQENPDAYFQAPKEASSRILAKVAATPGLGKGKFISSSVETRTDERGNAYNIYRGVIEIEGTPLVVRYSDKGGKENWEAIKSLQATQEDQTHYIETEGSLRQFNTQLQQRISLNKTKFKNY